MVGKIDYEKGISDFFIAAVVSIAGCCCPEKTPELTVIEFASSRDSNYNFGGRQYLVLLCKQGENFFCRVTFPMTLDKIAPFSPVIWEKMY